MGKTIKVGPYFVDYGPHTFHIRETEESRAIHEAIRPFFGDDPLILTRGTRVLLRGREYVYPLEMLQVLTGVSPILSARIIFDYVDGVHQIDVDAAEKRTLVRGVGRPEPRADALRPVLRHLLGARVGVADLADFLEAGAARREAEPQEHRAPHARHQGRPGDLLHQVHVPAQRHQRAVREHGGGGQEERPLPDARISGGAARARRRPDRARRLPARRPRGNDGVRRRAVDACRCRCWSI